MADVSVAAQLEQWAFDKTVPDQTRSSASSPNLSHPENETLRINTSTAEPTPSPDSKDTISLQERYLSSEEDLSPMEDGSSSASESEGEDDEDIIVYESAKEGFEARRMSIARFDKAKSCDMATRVSYVAAGRAKVIDLATTPTVSSPMPQAPPKRSASLALPPLAALDKLRHLDQSSRLSLAPTPSTTTTRSTSPALSTESRRPSTGHAPSSQNSSLLRVSESSSFTDDSPRSSSPAVSERSTRPASVAAHRPALQQPRSSLFISSTSAPQVPQTRPFPPLTPLSPETPSFLSSDPYETSTKNAASPILKQSPHKRLRSISMKLSLAKIAIAPATKKWDSRINGKPNMPPTPATPYTPMTPQTAPIHNTSIFSSPKDRLRRNSRASRPASMRGPSPEMPALPTRTMTPKAAAPPRGSTLPKLVPRGAAEREPVFELPDFPDEPPVDADPVVAMKKKVRKRKSLMDLMM